MQEKIICESCNNEAYGNFCAVCGNPISVEANVFVKQREKSIKLELVNNIISLVNDVETLQTLKEYVNNLINS